VSGWRDIAKRVAYWTVPPGFAESLRRQRAQCPTTAANPLLEQNRELYNRHAGQRCFILATGSSIKQQDLKPLAAEHCIAVSNFFVHPDFKTIKPRYYCVAPYHPPITEGAWQAWMVELDAGIGDATLFISLADKDRFSRACGGFARRKIHYPEFGGSWELLLTRGLDLTKAIPSPQSVTIMALLAALYMGFSKIYLLGCDHDWILHLGDSYHFYDEKLHALNRHGYNEWFGADVGSYCQDYVNLWQQYKAVGRIAQYQKAEILNATNGGMLDVFPRCRYETLLSSSSEAARAGGGTNASA
jgi:hypothetical protein